RSRYPHDRPRQHPLVGGCYWKAGECALGVVVGCQQSPNMVEEIEWRRGGWVAEGERQRPSLASIQPTPIKYIHCAGINARRRFEQCADHLNRDLPERWGWVAKAEIALTENLP